MAAEDTTHSAEAQSGNARVDAAAGSAAAGSGTAPAAHTGSITNAGTTPSTVAEKNTLAGQGGDAASAIGPAAAAGSGETQPIAGEGAPAEPAPRPRRAVSADSLARTRSIIDVDKLESGSKPADALLDRVDLVVTSISAGWLGLVGAEVPAGSEHCRDVVQAPTQLAGLLGGYHV